MQSWYLATSSRDVFQKWCEVYYCPTLCCYIKSFLRVLQSKQEHQLIIRTSKKTIELLQNHKLLISDKLLRWFIGFWILWKLLPLHFYLPNQAGLLTFMYSLQQSLIFMITLFFSIFCNAKISSSSLRLEWKLYYFELFELKTN